MRDVETVARLGRGVVHVTIGSALDIFGGKLRFDEDVMAYFSSEKAAASN